MGLELIRTAMGITQAKEVISSVQIDAARPSLALSLTVLQEKAAQRYQALSADLVSLGGINRIQGIMLEPDGEIIFLGERDASLPLISLEDLIVALSNAYQMPSYQGMLGCTIDPWSGSQDPWRIQQLRIFGMPATVAMATRHVAIDFALKKASTGIVSLGNGVPSLYEMTRSPSPPCEGSLEKIEQVELMHRFWFFPLFPPAPRFLEDQGIVLILKSVQVQLLTEQAFLDRTGQHTGSAPASAVAEHFAQLVTQLLATNQIHPYAQLHNDFRVIEVTQLLRFKQVPPHSLPFLK
jgi:hypothetical protein